MPDSGLGARPAHRLILGYLIAIAVGGLLLTSPLAAGAHGRVGLVDAVFTATSAVCVTGLSVNDTGSDFSLFGQAVILGLIQLGGLGVMTFSTFLLLGVRGRASMAVREATGDPLGAGSGPRLWPTLKSVFLLTLGFEVTGAALLFLTWTFGDAPPQGDWLQRAWDAGFHSTAAFCNAGFSTFSNNLEGFRGSVATNLTVMVLIVAGGLGFVSLMELGGLLPRRGPRRPRRLSSHTWMVLTVSAVLIVVGALGIYILEYHRALAGLGEGQKVLASAFQSVTARTAGFNTLRIGELAAPTLFLLILLMFVGASPCSTGGGIKTTTLGVMMATAWARLRGKEEAECFGRTVPRETVVRAAMLTILAAAIIGAVLLALLSTEPARNLAPGPAGEPEQASMEGGFLRSAFEAVSAFGTVGLSTGITAHLSDLGKMLIAVLMLIGRVGPLSLALALSRPAREQLVKLPESDVLIG